MIAISGRMLSHSFGWLAYNVLHFGQRWYWDTFRHHLVLIGCPICSCQARQRLLLQLPVLTIIVCLFNSSVLDTGENRCWQLGGGLWIAIGLRTISNAFIVSVEKLRLCSGLVYHLDLLITLVDGLLILAATWLESVLNILVDKCSKSWIWLAYTAYSRVADLIWGTLLQ